MAFLRATLYLAQCLYFLLALPGAGEALSGAGGALLAAARAGDLAARAFLGGVALFLCLAAWLRSALDFWYTLAHELSHAVLAFLLGGRPSALAVHASGAGEVRFGREPIILWLVLLAPYVLNPSYLAALVVPGLQAEARVLGAAAAGAAVAFAWLSGALQVRAYQSDIRRAGWLRSLLFIAWGNLLAAAVALALVTHGYRAALAALVTGMRPSLG